MTDLEVSLQEDLERKDRGRNRVGVGPGGFLFFLWVIEYHNFLNGHKPEIYPKQDLE